MRTPSVCNSSSWTKRRWGSVEGDELRGGEGSGQASSRCPRSHGSAARGRRASQRTEAEAREESQSSGQRGGIWTVVDGGVPERGSWRAGWHLGQLEGERPSREGLGVDPGLWQGSD